jgi:hypothetical protein
MWSRANADEEEQGEEVMGHHVTSETSDYFVGYCDLPGCTQRPCLSCVAAQEKLERAEHLRGKLVTAYHRHNQYWPQSRFIDAVVAVLEQHHEHAGLRSMLLDVYTQHHYRRPGDPSTWCSLELADDFIVAFKEHRSE